VDRTSRGHGRPAAAPGRRCGRDALRSMMRAEWAYVLVWLALLAWGLTALLA